MGLGARQFPGDPTPGRAAPGGHGPASSLGDGCARATPPTAPSHGPYQRADAEQNEGDKEGPGDQEGHQEAGNGRRRRPGDPAQGSHRATSAPHSDPNGRPHRPRPVTLCRGGGRSEVSVLYVQKRKTIKKAHSPAVDAVMGAERAAAASATPGLSLFARDAIVPSAGTPPPHQWPSHGRYGGWGAVPAP